MNGKNIAILIIVLLLIATTMYYFVIVPESNQFQMYDYNNEYLPTEFEYKLNIKCPVDYHSGNLTPVGLVKEHKRDFNVQGMRIKVVSIYYCEIHNIEFSIK